MRERSLPIIGRLIIVMLTASQGASALAEPTREYELKAAFIYNFAQFIEWPADAFADPNAPLVVGVVGDDPFDGGLEHALGGKSVNGHPLKVVRLAVGAEERDINGCHVLFIPAAIEPDRALRAVKGAPVLTVDESGRFLPGGGVIHLFVDGNKVRFEISPKAAKAAKLNVSAKLLKLAKIYEG